MLYKQAPRPSKKKIPLISGLRALIVGTLEVTSLVVVLGLAIRMARGDARSFHRAVVKH